MATASQDNPLRITPTGIELTAHSVPVDSKVPSWDQIEAELRRFEAEERHRLGLVEEELEQYIEDVPKEFTAAQREHTTMLIGGLTLAQDVLIGAALRGIGYKVRPLDVPDVEALHYGKEFGNRGQCNPTYFTVGNLVKHLVQLRDEKGMSSEEIIDKYLFLTAGACGPCRFGTYVTEYRKALRDAGFDGFRVLLFQQQGGLKQATGDKPGLDLSPKFFISLLKGIVAGDVLNAVGYRIRPYEVVPGATDKALDECKRILIETLENKKSVILTLRKCRKLLDAVEVDRLQAKPKVTIIGEFWAMTTEGDGNYKLQRFLESEGAEVDIQLVTAWVLYNIWEHVYDTKRRMKLRGADSGNFGLENTQPYYKLAGLFAAEKALRGIFQLFAKAIGMTNYHLADMDEIATISHDYYRNELRGGEGHMEVGKLIQSVQKKKAHMVLSVKPFGCMPSSGVSDGVQSLIVKKFPEAIFCPVETSGDGAVNVQSRIQMFLFKARKKARTEFEDALKERNWTLEEAQRQLTRKHRSATYYPEHDVAGTAANLLADLDAKKSPVWGWSALKRVAMTALSTNW